MTVTHRQLCRAVAGWFARQKWCEVVCWEVAGPSVPDPSRSWYGVMRHHEGRRGTVLDAVGLSDPTAAGGRIGVAECKRTRADLLSDLRSGKMLDYARMPGVSHLYLAVTLEVLGIDVRPGYGVAAEQVTARAEELGLPAGWGLLIVRDYGRDHGPIGVDCALVKKPVALAAPTPEQRTRWIVRAARSLAYRGLGHGPESDLARDAADAPLLHATST